MTRHFNTHTLTGVCIKPRPQIHGSFISIHTPLRVCLLPLLVHLHSRNFNTHTIMDVFLTKKNKSRLIYFNTHTLAGVFYSPQPFTNGKDNFNTHLHGRRCYMPYLACFLFKRSNLCLLIDFNTHTLAGVFQVAQFKELNLLHFNTHTLTGVFFIFH